MLLKNPPSLMGVALRVYPRYRVVNYEPVVIETEKGYVRIADQGLSRLLLLIAHMPGADVEKIAWAYVVSAENDDIDGSLEEARVLLKDLEKKGLILVV
ncbi:MAG: hypothetical protein QXK07_07635 [Desulfurococcaceae archaeon]